MSSSIAKLQRLARPLLLDSTHLHASSSSSTAASFLSCRVRYAMMSADSRTDATSVQPQYAQRPPRQSQTNTLPVADPPPLVEQLDTDASSPQIAARPPKAPRPSIRATKAALTITPEAVKRLKALSSGPSHNNLLRVGVRNKGCAGLSYHLEYVERAGKFDEVVEQDGVKVVIDSRALFSIIGSEMDWKEDGLSARFAFKNPNIVDACGCGESFTVGSSM